jgi:hypothetical protein
LIAQIPLKNSDYRESFTAKKHYYLRFNLSEIAIAKEVKSKLKNCTYEYSIGFRIHNMSEIWGLIPEAMSNIFMYNRFNQKKGFNFRYELKNYTKLKRKTYFGIAAETGYYWTPPSNQIEYFTYSDPVEIYHINKLYTVRAGFNFLFGWVGKNAGLKLYAGPRIQYYSLNYHLERPNYYSTAIVGERKSETGIRVRPTIRLFINIFIK